MHKILKKFSFLMVMGLAAALITGCVKKPDKDQIVAQINNYALTINDFKHEAKISIPGMSKELMLQDIIAKELLLQEAQKMNLDKNKLFMKEIEDYWKQSLIKRLINIKGEEFLAAARVSDQEIKAEYNRISEESAGKIKPFAEISGQIQERLKMMQAQVALDKWINSLQSNALIKKNTAVLTNINFKDTKNSAGGLHGK